MKVKTAGLIILMIVLLITLYTGFNNSVTSEKVVRLDNVQITNDNDDTVKWPPFIGIGVIVFCGAILLSGKKK